MNINASGNHHFFDNHWFNWECIYGRSFAEETLVVQKVLPDDWNRLWGFSFLVASQEKSPKSQ